MRSKKFASLKKFLRGKKKSMRLTRTTGAVVAVGVVGMCLAAAAILVAARQSSPPANVRTSKAQVELAGTEPTVGEVARFETKNSASNASAHEPAPVTITGCLERDAGTFRLEKTTGAGAPKSRSWKSGFLKKRSATIEVVDASKKLQLPKQVGRRVSVNGVLVDREMRARSLQRVAGSCED